MYLIFKRLFDVITSLLLLVLFSWLFFLIFLSYIVSFSFPVLFIQARVGQHEKIFKLLKFRTLKNLRPDEEEVDLLQRRFPLGDFLRRTSLDELPQLFNVLRGEMSLVGPRPLPVEYLPLYSAVQRKRHLVKPGITGYTQV